MANKLRSDSWMWVAYKLWLPYSVGYYTLAAKFYHSVCIHSLASLSPRQYHLQIMVCLCLPFGQQGCAESCSEVTFVLFIYYILHPEPHSWSIIIRKQSKVTNTQLELMDIILKNHSFQWYSPFNMAQPSTINMEPWSWKYSLFFFLI